MQVYTFSLPTSSRKSTWLEMLDFGSAITLLATPGTAGEAMQRAGCVGARKLETAGGASWFTLRAARSSGIEDSRSSIKAPAI